MGWVRLAARRGGMSGLFTPEAKSGARTALRWLWKGLLWTAIALTFAWLILTHENPWTALWWVAGGLLAAWLYQDWVKRESEEKARLHKRLLAQDRRIDRIQNHLLRNGARIEDLLD
jgi:hypothetical protein